MNFTDETTKQLAIKNCIATYNRVTGKNCQYGSKPTQDCVAKALSLASSAQELKTFVQDYCTKKKDGWDEILRPFQAFVVWNDFKASNPTPAPTPAPSSAPATKATDARDALNTITSLVTDMIIKTDKDKLQSAMISNAEEHIKKYIADNYGSIERKITLVLPDGNKKDLKGVLHEKFDEVLKFIAMGFPVFLTGPAGSGKNVLCQQVATALGLEFYFSNAVTQEYKLTGFTDAGGRFQETQFYQAFTKGGLFMLDEIDASIPEVLIILNAAIANGYFDFPAPVGRVTAHKNFRVIAAGNTTGNGADSDYVGRNQLDAATLNRFAQVEIDYDPRIEESCADYDKTLVDFCRAFRKGAYECGIHTVVSYRNITMIAQMRKSLDLKEILKTCLVKGLDKESVRNLRSYVSGFGEFSTAYNSLT